MFKSFFPKPGPFFISAIIWALSPLYSGKQVGEPGLHYYRHVGDVPITAQRVSGRWII
ncbi:hypothetical protein ACNKHK_01470 [Shigella flexneri]